MRDGPSPRRLTRNRGGAKIRRLKAVQGQASRTHASRSAAIVGRVPRRRIRRPACAHRGFTSPYLPRVNPVRTHSPPRRARVAISDERRQEMRSKNSGARRGTFVDPLFDELKRGPCGNVHEPPPSAVKAAQIGVILFPVDPAVSRDDGKTLPLQSERRCSRLQGDARLGDPGSAKAARPAGRASRSIEMKLSSFLRRRFFRRFSNSTRGGDHGARFCARRNWFACWNSRRGRCRTGLHAPPARGQSRRLSGLPSPPASSL